MRLLITLIAAGVYHIYNYPMIPSAVVACESIINEFHGSSDVRS
jgi:hypothetical protein